MRVPGGPDIPESEFVERFSRASGPGGQSVNTTDSRVELRWDVASSAALDEVRRERLLRRLRDRLVDGAIVIVASEQRSQRQNRTAARERLAELVAAALAPPPPRRRPTRPTRSAREERLTDKRRRGEVKSNRARPDPE